MHSENERLETRVTELQSQLLSQEKEMEELIRGDQEKTEQLQHLKIGNDQLCLSLTEQREQQRKLEQMVEEIKLREAAAVKTQADLMDENLDLSRRLGENKLLCDHLQGERARVERDNDHLRKENSRLMSYMGLDFDSLPHQVPAAHLEGADQEPGLLYGNPYSGVQESSASGLLCAERPLTCPICDRVFPTTEKQIFEDHMYCHSL
ncbi:calcium-binding and coiled-coil domain-containing protein 2 [Octodon degus]|uniref:Calcium-binding and coiled-coil domain-containing protein 2 n=1 Tax=Octodon degus TaxID=10160 RepID=A0A6P6ENL0_OCTDE|nr:calcium-binding and coiled-coil domain-containing protein 2 [Octodon degus]